MSTKPGQLHIFGPARHWQTGKRFITVKPSKKAQKRLKKKISTLLRRGNLTPWPELRARLKRLISGWTGYFSFGFTLEAYQAIRWHLAVESGGFLCRRHKLLRGIIRFGFREVYGALGVIDVHRLRRQRSAVHALS